MHNFSWTAGTVFWRFVLCRCQSVLAQGETPNDPAYQRYPADPHQEGLFLLDMEHAWKLEKGSPQVLVAVVDLAFNVEHPDLKGKLWSNPREVPGNGRDDDGNGCVDDVHGWDFLDNDATLDGPQAEHGNHVAGILAAQIIGAGDAEVMNTVVKYKEGLKKKIVEANEELKKIKFPFKTN